MQVYMEKLGDGQADDSSGWSQNSCRHMKGIQAPKELTIKVKLDFASEFTDQCKYIITNNADSRLKLEYHH